MRVFHGRGNVGMTHELLDGDEIASPSGQNLLTGILPEISGFGWTSLLGGEVRFASLTHKPLYPYTTTKGFVISYM